MNRLTSHHVSVSSNGDGSGPSVAGRRRSGARPPADSQHFLRDPRLAAQLVREAGVGARDLVVDIGAGSGRLTAELSWDCAPRARNRAGPSLGGAAGRPLADAACSRRTCSRSRSRAKTSRWSRTCRSTRQPRFSTSCSTIRRPPRPRGSRGRVGHRDPTGSAVAEPREEHRLGLDVRDRRHATAAPRRVRPRAPRRCGCRLVPAPPRPRPTRRARAVPSLRRLGLQTRTAQRGAARQIEQLAGRGATARDLDAHQWAQLFLRG